MMTHGSLFTGIGVFDFAAHNHGFKNVFGCDIDPFSKIHYTERNKNSLFFDDITKVNEIPYVDLLTFGFPCQDASNANSKHHKNPLDEKRTGLFWRAIGLVRQSKPKFVIAENVAAIRNKGLERCLKAFAESGYYVGYAIIPACTFGALHERERCFIVANAHSIGGQKVLQILNSTLAQGTNYKGFTEPTRTKSNRVLLQEMEKEAQYFINGDTYGTTEGLHIGIRAKSIGNAIYYPIAEAFVKSIKQELFSLPTEGVTI